MCKPHNQAEFGNRLKLMPICKPILTSVAKVLAYAILLLPSNLSSAVSIHHCSDMAREQAGRLLAFHYGSTNRIEIDKSVRELNRIPNPANKGQFFDVLEVWGYIYKGQYRMRFIYAKLPDKCVLMGQEILEYASL